MKENYVGAMSDIHQNFFQRGLKKTTKNMSEERMSRPKLEPGTSESNPAK